MRAREARSRSGYRRLGFMGNFLSPEAPDLGEEGEGRCRQGAEHDPGTQKTLRKQTQLEQRMEVREWRGAKAAAQKSQFPSSSEAH